MANVIQTLEQILAEFRHMNKLPENLLQQGLELAKGSMFCGVLLSDMSREELLAVAALGWKKVQAQDERSERLRTEEVEG